MHIILVVANKNIAAVQVPTLGTRIGVLSLVTRTRVPTVGTPIRVSSVGTQPNSNHNSKTN